MNWLSGYVLGSHSMSGEVHEVTLVIDNSKLWRASEHDLSTVPSDGVKLSTDMRSLYAVVFLAALLPGESF